MGPAFDSRLMQDMCPLTFAVVVMSYPVTCALDSFFINGKTIESLNLVAMAMHGYLLEVLIGINNGVLPECVRRV